MSPRSDLAPCSRAQTWLCSAPPFASATCAATVAEQGLSRAPFAEDSLDPRFPVAPPLLLTCPSGCWKEKGGEHVPRVNPAAERGATLCHRGKETSGLSSAPGAAKFNAAQSQLQPQTHSPCSGHTDPALDTHPALDTQTLPWGHTDPALPAAPRSLQSLVKEAVDEGGCGLPGSPRFCRLSAVSAKIQLVWAGCSPRRNSPPRWSTPESSQDRFLLKVLVSYVEGAETRNIFMGVLHFQTALKGQSSSLSGHKTSRRLQSLAGMCHPPALALLGTADSAGRFGAGAACSGGGRHVGWGGLVLEGILFVKEGKGEVEADGDR